MILTHDCFIRYRVVCRKDERQRVIDLFSAGPNPTTGIHCESGEFENPHYPGLVSYSLIVNASDAQSIARIEALR